MVLKFCGLRYKISEPSIMEDAMTQSILEFALQLTQAGKPFVLATVVRCERPTSAKPGSQAIIQDNGQVVGWIGGSCTQPVVIREATRILHEGGDPFILRLGTSDTESQYSDPAGIRSFPMTCASGGALDIYLEPHLPQPQFLLIGASPIIDALKQFALILDFTTNHLDQTDLSQVQIDERTYILIATHGHYDEDILTQVLTSPAAYIGMVSSPRRADACRDYLRTAGISEQAIARLKAPAGLDIGAVTPEEIAASIIAELIEIRRRPTDAGSHTTPAQAATNIAEDSRPAPEPAPATTATDPVCGMIVEIASARHKVQYDGREFYFCCPACKRQFEREPQKYLVTNER
jgi:xanthine dehydrogenase accessory factor